MCCVDVVMLCWCGGGVCLWVFVSDVDVDEILGVYVMVLVEDICVVLVRVSDGMFLCVGVSMKFEAATASGVAAAVK